MLLPSTSPTVAFQPDYHHQGEGFDGKRRSFSPSASSPAVPERHSRDLSPRGRFRFCVCTGGNKKASKKTLTKWYIKVREYMIVKIKLNYCAGAIFKQF